MTTAQAGPDDLDASPTAPIETTPTTIRMLARGLAKRCPACGSSQLFTHYLRMVERCPGCGLRLHRHEGQMTGDIGVNTVVTLVLMFAVLMASVFGVGESVPIGLVIVIGGLVVLGFPVFFLPYSKTIWLAIDIATNPLDPGEHRVAPPPATDLHPDEKLHGAIPSPDSPLENGA